MTKTFEIILHESIQASSADTWSVINDLDSYHEWNPFVLKCQSSLEVGAPIIMHVKLIPGMTLRQKETIRDKRRGEFLEYGVKVPGLLKSSRQHILSATGDDACRYDSVFRLEGILAPVIGFLLGKQLRLGFTSMTVSLKQRAQDKTAAAA